MNKNTIITLYLNFSYSEYTVWYNKGITVFKIFHLGRYIAGYTVRNSVLRQRARGAIKQDFRMYLRPYTSPNEIFEYGYPQSNALLQFRHKLKRYKPYKSHVFQRNVM